MQKIGILGAGAFGTALAFAYHKVCAVTLFSCFEEHVESMRKNRINEFFDEFKIPEDVEIALPDELNGFDYLLWAFPIKPTQELLQQFRSAVNGTPMIICSKGLMPDSTFIYDLFKKELNNSKIGYLAGPNFALEIAQGKPTSADIAAKDIDAAKTFSEKLTTDNLRLNPINDLIGAQLCGAVKNITAIASGIILGLDLGQNAHAALITRALEEMKNFGIKLGAQEKTFYGLCGLGDLILTTSSTTSRNTSLGVHIARGHAVEEILKNSTCEGYDTLPQVIELVKKHNVNLPICEIVYKILFENKSPDSIIDVFK